MRPERGRGGLDARLGPRLLLRRGRTPGTAELVVILVELRSMEPTTDFSSPTTAAPMKARAFDFRFAAALMTPKFDGWLERRTSDSWFCLISAAESHDDFAISPRNYSRENLEMRRRGPRDAC